MRGKSIGAASAIALVFSGTAQAVPAKSCLTANEIHGLVAFALPDVVDGMVKKCSATLRPDGYFNSQGSQLAERLAVGKDAAWPMASQAFRKFGDDFKGKPSATLSDRTLRAVIENEVVEKMLGDLPVKACGDIEAIVQTLDPLPAENMIQFVSAVFGVAGRGGNKLNACSPT